MSHLILTDIHGSYKTMLAMIDKYGNGRQPILLGDLIDRGPHSREVVEFAINNRIPTVSGNHEDLAMAYSEHAKLGYKNRCGQHYDDDVWLANGGIEAMESWDLDFTIGATLPKRVLDWFSKLPPYIVIDEENNGRKLLCSHTGYGLDADKDNWLRALWGRYPNDGEFTHFAGEPIDDGYFRVFGHTRVREPLSGPGWINIDTGCAYKGYGKLTGLLWPEGETVQMDNQD